MSIQQDAQSNAQMNVPLVSLIIPVYNVLDYMRRSLDAALSQTYPHLEIVMVDDGSTDGSGAVCDEYAARKMREGLTARVIHTENHGLSAARNRGLDEAAGEYIVFLDADDYLSADCVQILYDTLTCEPDERPQSEDGSGIKAGREAGVGIAAAVTGCETDYRFGRRDSAVSEISYHDLMELSKTRPEYQAAWAKIYRRDLFDGNRFPEGRIFEDTAITYRLFYEAGRIHISTAEVYYYLQREGSLVHEGFSLRKLEGLKSYEERLAFFRQIGDMRLYYSFLQQLIAIEFSDYHLMGRYLAEEQEARRELLGKIRKNVADLCCDRDYPSARKLVFRAATLAPDLAGKYITRMI